jgi:hypothetical protein
MKKILFLSLAFIGILTFSGCNQPIKPSETPPAPLPLENTAISPEIPLEINTTVDSLSSYSSPDEILDDIDTAMEDLDNL